MRVFKKETRTYSRLAGIICDICNRSLDLLSLEGYRYYEDCAFIEHTFGFGTKKDGKSLDIDICEPCLIKKFSAYIK